MCLLPRRSPPSSPLVWCLVRPVSVYTCAQFSVPSMRKWVGKLLMFSSSLWLNNLSVLSSMFVRASLSLVLQMPLFRQQALFYLGLSQPWILMLVSLHCLQMLLDCPTPSKSITRLLYIATMLIVLWVVSSSSNKLFWIRSLHPIKWCIPFFIASGIVLTHIVSCCCHLLGTFSPLILIVFLGLAA